MAAAGPGQPGAAIVPFPGQGGGQGVRQVAFDRPELQKILDLYGRMVAAGFWRDYAMNFEKDVAVFSAYVRAADRPQARIEKRPALRNKQGMWTLFGEVGQILKRGHELASVLSPLERKLMKVVD